MQVLRWAPSSWWLVFVFGSFALLCAVIMAVAGIGNLLSGGSKADEQVFLQYP
jgi:hypothetical protein